MLSYKNNTLILTFIIIVLFSLQNTYAQKLLKFDDMTLDLQNRWKTSVEQVKDEPVWIGYSINKLMSHNGFIGSFHSEQYGPSLKDILSGKVDLNSVKKNNEGYRQYHWNDGESVEKELKEVAVFIKVGKDSKKGIVFKEVSVNNIDLFFDTEGLSIYWLGNAGYDESVDLLSSIYEKTGDNEVKEDIVSAVGIHDDAASGYKFLHTIIFSDEIDDVRENAVFWISRYKNPDVLNLMIKIAGEDKSEDVREKAVFGLHMIDTDEATDALIDLARNSEKVHIRKQAIFWLGQTASKKAISALDETVSDEDEAEVQKQAVFAISQLDSDESIPRLIRIAKTHPNPEIRKKAIFWLGQSEDDRALDAIIGFLKN